MTLDELLAKLTDIRDELGNVHVLVQSDVGELDIYTVEPAVERDGTVYVLIT